jgi:transposase
MPKTARSIRLTATQRQVLRKNANAKVKSRDLVERSQIILWCDEGLTNVEQARRLGVHEQRVRRWRQRWARVADRLAQAEEAGASLAELRDHIEDVLSDSPRTGAPAKFSAEQITQLIALACETPQESGIPVTHWTPKELAKEARKRGIVESISARHLDRLLKRGRSSTS